MLSRRMLGRAGFALSVQSGRESLLRPVNNNSGRAERSRDTEGEGESELAHMRWAWDVYRCVRTAAHLFCFRARDAVRRARARFFDAT